MDKNWSSSLNLFVCVRTEPLDDQETAVQDDSNSQARTRPPTHKTAPLDSPNPDGRIKGSDGDTKQEFEFQRSFQELHRQQACFQLHHTPIEDSKKMGGVHPDLSFNSTIDRLKVQ